MSDDPQTNFFSISVLERILVPPARRTDVPSWHGHMPFARWLIKTVQPRTLVELGVHKGDSYCAFCEAVVDFHAPTQCFGIDCWQGDEHAGYYDEQNYQDIVNYHDRRYGAFSRLIRARFQDALDQFADGSIDLLHIDGLHTYHAVRQDFRDWLPKMSPRGVVLFHDSAVQSGDFGVWRFFAEIARQYPHFEFSHSHGLGVVAVGSDIPPAIAWLTSLSPVQQAQVRSCFTSFGGTLLEKSRHEEELRRLQVDFDARSDAENRRHAEEIAAARAAIVKYEGEIALLKQELARLETDFTARSNEDARRHADEIAGARAAIVKYEDEITQLKREQVRLEAEALARSNEDARRHAEEIAAVRAAIVKYEDEITQLKREQVRLEAEALARSNDDARRHADEIAAVHSSIVKYEDDITLLKREQGRLENEIANQALGFERQMWLKDVEISRLNESGDMHRANAEQQRNLADEYRGLIETARAAAEDQRRKADEARAAAEEARRQADEIRHYAESLQQQLEQFRQHAEGLQRQLDESRQQAEHNWGQAEQLRNAAEQYRAQVEADNAAIAALKSQQENLSNERSTLQHHGEHFRHVAAALADRLNAIQQSTSWRVTRPMRGLMGLVRGGGPGMSAAMRDAPPATLPALPAAMPFMALAPMAPPALPPIPVPVPAPTPAPAAAAEPAPAQPVDPKAAFKQEKAAEFEAFLATDARISFPVVETPEISILVILFNQAPLTYACLQSLAATVDMPVEVIIVDNASSDQTNLLLDRIDGAHIIRNSENLHFLRAVNQGAAEVRGKSLLLLNNDACLYPGSLSTAFSLLYSADDVGAVGGRIILLDGGLQEAGSIIWQDGSCLGYGRGGHPQAAEFMFRRDVDYCSGAFLLTRMDVFRELNGFDMAFAPAYYEETDYCVRLRKAGYRIIYDPRVCILHYEFASSTSSAAAIALQQRNREIFIDHHREHLERHHLPSNAAPLIARMVNNHKGRILIIDDRVPHHALGSGYPRACSYLTLIHEAGWFVTHYPLQFPHDDWEAVYRTVPAGVEVMLNHGRDGLEPFLVDRAGYYDAILISRPHNMEAFVACQKRHPDIFKGVRIIYDAEAIFTPREADRLKLAGTPMSLRQQEKMLKEEMSLAVGADAIFAVSEPEAEQFRIAGCRDVHVLGHLVTPTPTGPDFDARRNFLFVGALDDDPSPNVDSILWFAEEVLPRIQRSLPDVQLQLVGRSGAARIQELSGPDVVLFGKVPDLEASFAQARVFIVPTRYAAGIPHKVHEAAAHGLPMVTTALIARQVGWDDGEQLLVGDDAERFAEQCIRLYTDAALWERVRDAALIQVEEDCSPRHFRSALDAVLGEGRNGATA